MAQIRLVPSAYKLSNTSYLNISDAANMYNNIDNTTYATVNHTRTGTTAYYIYVKGFNWSDIPSGAVITSAIVKVKAAVTSASTSQKPALYNNTTAISGAPTFGTNIGTSTTTSTVDITNYFETYKNYGSDFSIRLYLNRSNRNTASNMKIYGAEILIEYTIPVSHIITTSCTDSSITISPSGTTTVYEGNSFELSIDSSTNPVVTDNGANVSSQLTQRSKSDTTSAVISAYTTSGSISGTYYQSAVGKGSDTTATTGNNYCQTSGSTADINYTFDLSAIPSGAEIVSVACAVKGHLENASQSTEVAKCQLYTGTTAKGSSTSFTSTTDAVINLNCGSWTRAELDNLILKFTIGYYGGNVSGATLSITYSLGEGYFYIYIIDNILADHTIVVSKGDTPVVTETLMVKENGNWKTVLRAYKKINGSWVEQTNLTTIFDTDKNYVKM